MLLPVLYKAYLLPLSFHKAPLYTACIVNEYCMAMAHHAYVYLLRASMDWTVLLQLSGQLSWEL